MKEEEKKQVTGHLWAGLAQRYGFRMVSAEAPRFDSASALLSLQNFRFTDTAFVTLPLPINEALKWPSSLSILMQNHSAAGDSVAFTIPPHPQPPTPIPTQPPGT